MKKIILLVCCIVFFSITVCNAESDIDKLKGCWEIKYGSLGIPGGDLDGGKVEIGDNYIKIGEDFIINVTFEETDTHIIMNRTRKNSLGMTSSDKKYVLKKTITDSSFRESNILETSPEKGKKYTRIQCSK